ncbi:MAG: chemotaxis protein CheB [Deltaproteobacteria bacterium]|nr:MAG: chemotaxis protein CheB [Deltaproteobacteria bacterium]
MNDLPAPPSPSLVVIGVSAGGFDALRRLLGGLPADFPLPVLIVQHLRAGSVALAETLQRFCAIRLKEADEGEPLAPATVYFAPADYHLLVERDSTLALSVDPPVRYARPAVDVLFESAADAFGPGVVGVVLTGANDDGSRGLRRIKAAGGTAIVQDPADAEAAQMPASALAAGAVDHVLPLADIAALLCTLAGCAAPQGSVP